MKISPINLIIGAGRVVSDLVQPLIPSYAAQVFAKIGNLFGLRPIPQPIAKKQFEYDRKALNAQIEEIDWTQFQTIHECILVKNAIHALDVRAEQEALKEQRDLHTTVRDNTRNFLEQLKQPDATLQKQITKMSEGLKMTEAEAAAKLKQGAEELLVATNQSIQEIDQTISRKSPEQEEAVKKGIYLISLLKAINDLKKQGISTEDLVHELSKHARYADEQKLREVAEPLLEATKKSKTAALSKSASFFDQLICHQRGGNIIKSEGEFLYAEVPTTISSQDKALLTSEEISRCLAATNPIKGAIETSLFGTKSIVPKENGNRTLYPVVRVKIENGKIVVDPRGPIRLYKLPVKDSIQTVEKADFGDRQRIIMDPTNRYVIKVNKGFDDRAEHKNWNYERRRTAAIGRAESLLVMEALLKAQLKGTSSEISYNDFLRMTTHVDSLGANDVAKLEESFLSDPVYEGQIEIYNRCKFKAQEGSLAHNSYLSTKRLLDGKTTYSWKQDQERLQKLKEIDTSVLGHFISNAEKTLRLIDQNSFTSNRLNWFQKEISALLVQALKMRKELNKSLEFLSKSNGSAADVAQNEEKINAALFEFIAQMKKFYEIGNELAVVAGSTKITDKLRKYLSELSKGQTLLHTILGCYYGTPQQLRVIGDQLRDTYMKPMQEIAHIDLLSAALIEGIPFSPSLLKTIEFYQRQKRLGFERESNRLELMYERQKVMGYRAVKSHFFPNR